MPRSVAKSPGVRLRLEKSEISLLGAREINQDRVAGVIGKRSALLVVCDGMGGHSDGERAAEIALQSIREQFAKLAQPLFDPQGFLHIALGFAHEKLVAFGAHAPVESRPRATCAVALVQDGASYWAHVGDSRVYHLRDGHVVTRTRDHSHVELLLREGLIVRDQMQSHPMRNFVESCLGGEPLLPEMTLSTRHAMLPGDLLLLCTDGLWGNSDEDSMARAFGAPDAPLDATLKQLAERAVAQGGATADNTSALVLRLLE